VEEVVLKKSWLVVLGFCTVLAFAFSTLAAPYPVKLIPTVKGLQISAEQLIRFYVDYSQKKVILPEAAIEEGAMAGTDVKLESRQDGFILTMPYDFSVTLAPNGRLLTILKDGGLSIAETPKDPRVPVFYFLVSAQPAQVSAILTRLYPGLKVEVDERQRALIVLMNPDDRSIIDEVIKKLDVARPQVMFEAEILEINRKYSQQLGIDYSKLINLNFKFTEGTPPNGSIGTAPFQRSPLTLEVGINLLKTNGVARTLARPRVAVMDGLEARINATQTQPIKTVGQGGQITVSNITTGINLRLLPKVAPDQTIESQLSIAVSSPTGTTSEGLPTYSTREANTTLRVKNAETIVIGGLLESRRSTASSGVPGLMDIPIVGELFKTTFTDESDTDLLIVVTPYIVSTASNGALSNPTPVPSQPQPSAPPKNETP
jgi:general secretion pathway protein D